jgi:hypothetical protein
LFQWDLLPARGTTGGILIGVRDEVLLMCNVRLQKILVSCMILDRRKNFSWKLVVVYGSPYDEGKIEFIDELQNVMSSWQGPLVIGGDFNLSRFLTDKSNGRIVQKYADSFNDWINRWGLIGINPTNRKFTWANNQRNLVLARLNKVFVSTDWGLFFPLARVVCLDKGVSDHTPSCWILMKTYLGARRNSSLKNGGWRGRISRTLFIKPVRLPVLKLSQLMCGSSGLGSLEGWLEVGQQM